ncbi:MAG: hypothetical protein LBJ64_10040, partial [Deltaproteobacteria bacterium]|nr:hypothetical protein [Deltaproteobacteria bacterium]
MAAQQNNPAIVEAWGYYEVLSAEEEALLLAESREKARRDFVDRYNGAYREGIEIGRQKGIEIGRQIGIGIGRQEARQEVRETTALNFVRKKMPHEVIAEVTGLPIEEIQRLEATLSDSKDYKEFMTASQNNPAI